MIGGRLPDWERAPHTALEGTQPPRAFTYTRPLMYWAYYQGEQTAFLRACASAIPGVGYIFFFYFSIFPFLFEFRTSIPLFKNLVNPYTSYLVKTLH